MTKFLAAYLKAARQLDEGGWKDPRVLDIVARYTGGQVAVLRDISYTIRPADGAIDMASVREQEQFFRAQGTLDYKGNANIDAVYRRDILQRANRLLQSKP